MTSGSAGRDVPGTGGVRWYRHGGERLLAVIMVSFVGVYPLWLVIYGIGNPVRWALLIPGVVLVGVCAALAALPARAGIGVTPEHILIRTGTGRTTPVPWAQVTGFEAARSGPRGRGTATVVVLTSDGRRLRTMGYGTTGTSPAEMSWLLRALEGERAARAAGTVVSALPPRPRPGPGGSRAASVWAAIGILALIILGGLPLYSGVTELGPAIRAARGEGTAGYFIPQREISGRGAAWYGEFRLPDGSITLRNVSIEDLSVSAMQVGVPVAARDTGYSGDVFPRDDPGAWHLPVIVTILGMWAYVWAIILLVRAAARRLRPSRRALEYVTGDTPDAPGTDAAAQLAQQRGWSFSPVARRDRRQRRSTAQAGLQLGRLNGTLDGRQITVVLFERVTSVGIVLPAGTVPKVRIRRDRDSGQLIYQENAALGESLMTPSAREALDQAGFASVTFSQNQLAGAFPRVLAPGEIIDALRGLETLLAAMPGDVLKPYGILNSGGAEEDDRS